MPSPLLPLDKTRGLTDVELRSAYLNRQRSKITKVYIEEINDMEDFNFIGIIYPYMIYLKVKLGNNMDIYLVWCTILKDIYTNDLCSIRSLCVYVPAADDQMIENLQQMIKYEQLLIQFTIKRILDNIYLQWK